METFTDLSAARAFLDDDGGWLLDLGFNNNSGFIYGVTDDKGIVIDLRGAEFIVRCENLHCWDETIIVAHPAESVHCGCGEAIDQMCAWWGAIEDTVIVEFMPGYLRASHIAAGNSGSYPQNGAMRLRCHRECAQSIREGAPEWTRIIDD